MFSLRAWIAVLLVDSAASFVPLTPSTINAYGNARPDTVLHWGSGWFGGSKKGEPVRFIALNSSEDDKDPTDVYVSRMDADNLSKGDVIDTIMATEVKPAPKAFAGKTDFDVIVVGAGCAGIGTAIMLTRTFGLDKSRVLMVEQGKEVGDSFRKWPEEMKFISPSFNQQGWTYSFDLNAIHYDTSPAHMLRSEHPSGEEYAIYLEQIVKQGELQVQLETKVTSIRDMGKTEDHPGPFDVGISKEGGATETLSTRYVVWAAGEFGFPKIANKEEEDTKKENRKDGADQKSADVDSLFPGAELCTHNSHVRSWKKLPGNDFVIIGGYESGVDAAINLAQAGRKCKILASTPCWSLQTGDPSTELAPYTAARLRDVLSPTFGPNPQLLAPIRVIAVDKAEGGGFNVAAKWKAVDGKINVSGYSGFKVEEPGEKDSIIAMHTPQAPILCTGFEGSVAAQASDLFAFPDPGDKKGCLGDGPLLTKNDESTTVPGVFLVGPSVTHGDLSFCFVYKFRQRFAVVSNAICQGLGMDTKAAVEHCRFVNMYLDDFETCEGTCGDAC